MNRTSSLQIRVAIVDDHNLVCAALAELLKLDGRFQVVAQVYDGLSAKALFTRDDIDVILLDLELPGAHGLEALKWKTRGARICILSMYTDAHFVTEAFKAGASGYISKQAVAAELVKGLHAVANGESFLSSDLQSNTLSQALKKRDRGVTQREQEVLRLSASGLKSAEVAGKLNISRRTAEAHRANVMKKLSLKTQTDLVRYALRHQIISVERFAK